MALAFKLTMNSFPALLYFLKYLGLTPKLLIIFSFVQEGVQPLHACKTDMLGECVPDPKGAPLNMVNQALHGHYIPNRKTIICLAILKISQPQWITLRVWLSRPNIQFFLR